VRRGSRHSILILHGDQYGSQADMRCRDIHVPLTEQWLRACRPFAGGSWVAARQSPCGCWDLACASADKATLGGAHMRCSVTGCVVLREPFSNSSRLARIPTTMSLLICTCEPNCHHTLPAVSASLSQSSQHQTWPYLALRRHCTCFLGTAAYSRLLASIPCPMSMSMRVHIQSSPCPCPISPPSHLTSLPSHPSSYTT
jgi:hypothetical protein